MKRTFLLAALVALSVSGCGSAYVKQGNVGLVVDNFTGKIDQFLNPGYRLAIPIGQHIIEFPVIKQQYVMVAGNEGQRSGEDDSVKVNSLEGQSFTVEASIEYRIHDKDSVAPLYQKYAKPFDDIVEQYYRSKFRKVIVDGFSSLPMNDAITGAGRKKVENQALAELRDTLKDDKIDVYGVYIRAVNVPESIANSIAAKTQAENELIKARTVAQQQIVEAEAEAKARMIRATAEANANHLLASSLTPELVKLKAIETINPHVAIVAPSNAFLPLQALLDSTKTEK